MLQLQDLFFIRKCENFQEVKENCLQHFDQFKFSYCNGYQKISNTDWHLDQNLVNIGGYIFYLQNPIESHLTAFNEEFGYEQHKAQNIWFQQYLKGDRHCLHTHADSNFSNVLYLELPDKTIATKFYFKGEEIEVNVNEGDMITFPSFFVHESPVNQSEERKTIVSFNSSVERY